MSGNILFGADWAHCIDPVLSYSISSVVTFGLSSRKNSNTRVDEFYHVFIILKNFFDPPEIRFYKIL